MRGKTTQVIDQEIQTMSRYVDMINTSGEHVIVPAPGQGRRIVIVYAIVENVPGTTTIVILGEGSSANAIFRFNTSTLVLFEFFSTLGREVRLAANTALTLNLSAAVAHNVNVYYFTEDC